MLCISRHPKAQARAQNELDAIIGQDRMPHMDDVAQFPYIEAIIKEVSILTPTSFVLFTEPNRY